MIIYLFNTEEIACFVAPRDHLFSNFILFYNSFLFLFSAGISTQYAVIFVEFLCSPLS